MHRVVPILIAPLLGYIALAGCSSSTPNASSAPPASTARTQRAGKSTAPAPAPAKPASANGTITFKGALSGKMTISSCHGELAQLVVAVDGQDETYIGLIDADDFTFAVPHSTGFTLAEGASKPRVSDTTYTVRNTKLVSITNDDTVTANGSVTCP